MQIQMQRTSALRSQLNICCLYLRVTGLYLMQTLYLLTQLFQVCCLLYLLRRTLEAVTLVLVISGKLGMHSTCGQEVLFKTSGRQLLLNTALFVKSTLATYVTLGLVFSDLLHIFSTSTLWITSGNPRKATVTELSDTSKPALELRSNRLAVFCRNKTVSQILYFTLPHKFPWKLSVMESLFSKTASPHASNCTKNHAIASKNAIINVVM